MVAAAPETAQRPSPFAQETLRARRAAAGAGGASAATSFAADGVASVCGGAARGDAAHELLRHWLPLLSGHYEFRHLDAAASTGLPSRREALVGLELRTLVCGSSNAVAGVAEGGNDAAGGSDHRAVAAVRVAACSSADSQSCAALRVHLSPWRGSEPLLTCPYSLILFVDFVGAVAMHWLHPARRWLLQPTSLPTGAGPITRGPSRRLGARSYAAA